MIPSPQAFPPFQAADGSQMIDIPSMQVPPGVPPPPRTIRVRDTLGFTFTDADHRKRFFSWVWSERHPVSRILFRAFRAYQPTASQPLVLRVWPLEGPPEDRRLEKVNFLFLTRRKQDLMSLTGSDPERSNWRLTHQVGLFYFHFVSTVGDRGGMIMIRRGVECTW
jgi:hypothetical protein